MYLCPSSLEPNPTIQIILNNQGMNLSTDPSFYLSIYIKGWEVGIDNHGFYYYKDEETSYQSIYLSLYNFLSIHEVVKLALITMVPIYVIISYLYLPEA